MNLIELIPKLRTTSSIHLQFNLICQAIKYFTSRFESVDIVSNSL